MYAPDPSLIGIFWKSGRHVIGVQAQRLILTMKLSFFVSMPRRAQSSIFCIFFSHSPSWLHITRLAVQRLRIMFRVTSRLLVCRVTFFTRTPCGLCDTAKAVVQDVKLKRPLEYQEINVMDPGQEKWKSLYEFDTPVVRLSGLSAPIYMQCAEYLNVQIDPHRQGRGWRDHRIFAQADASSQRRRCDEVDGPS